MKHVIKKAIDLILSILSNNKKLYTYCKYKYFTKNSDHILFTISYINNNYLSQEKNIIDIGAADGSTTLSFAKELTNSIVIGFEPIPKFYNIALEKCKEQTNVIVKNIAISNDTSKRKFNVTNNLVSSSFLPLSENDGYKGITTTEEIEVQCNTLDNEVEHLGHIMLIKLDVQGS